MRNSGTVEHRYITRLQKPLYVYMMANNDDRANSGAETRMRNAVQQIEAIVLEWAERIRPTPPPSPSIRRRAIRELVGVLRGRM